MHDKPEGRIGLTRDDSTDSAADVSQDVADHIDAAPGDISAMVADLEAADPAAAPNIADAIASHLESELGPTDAVASAEPT